MTAHPEVILGIESAVAGGSLCVLADGKEIGSWVGKSEHPLRAEVLMIEITKLLRRVSVEKSQLTRVAVSSGPGSFTGIRVGLATAMGLTGGLGIEISRASVLEALAAATSHSGAVLVPVGRGTAVWQMFKEGIPMSEPASIDQTLLSAATDGNRIVAHSSLQPVLGGAAEFVTDLAFPIAKFAERWPERSSAPIFLSKK